MERYIDSDGAKIWTDVRGTAARGMVFLANGGPGSADYLRPVSEMIEDGYRVIRFEQRGCGRSTADGNYGIETALSDLEAIRIAYGADRWVAGGHSWGANLALLYTLKYPERVSDILYLAGNGLQRNRDWSEAYRANRDREGEILPKTEYPPNEEVNRAGNDDYRRLIQKPTLFSEISKLSQKALFLVAGRDIRPSWPAQQLCYLMKNATLAAMENAAHYFWFSDYALARNIIRNFLKLAP